MTMTAEDDFDAMYGSKYFSVPDLKGQRPRRTIGKVEVAELKEKDGTTKRKRILYLEGEDKPLVLNKTNAVKLAMAFGKNSADWVGGRIELYAEMTNARERGRPRAAACGQCRRQPAPSRRPSLSIPIWTTKFRSNKLGAVPGKARPHSRRQPKFKLARK